ncbi:MAG TPA: 23S rRNA (uracil(1939)-C(5))-methyltransferase RlmD [Chloroflexota bacterium]|nr:23S rRNA (uracil(1939)-C(5))-methyltransferase RlmD [Chloroflexota bacterium]
MTIAHEEKRAGRKRSRPPIEAELQLAAWTARGSATAQLDGRTVAIDRGIPGERVIAEVRRERGGRRGVVRSVLEPSPDRVAPPCPFFSRDCGGCQLQHVSYRAQLALKRDRLHSELQAAGVPARIDAVHGMDEPWRYRHTAAIALGWEAGFRPRGRRGIVALDDCLISHPLIGGLAARLNELLAAGALPRYHGKVWLDCVVTGTRAQPTLQVLIQGIAGLTLESHPELREVGGVLAGLDGVESVAFRHRSGEARALAGDLWAKIELDGRLMYLPAGSFFQTNLAMLERLIGAMRARLTGDSGTVSAVRQAADLYGGAGTFGLALAPLVQRMTLVELDPAAVQAATRTAAEWGLDNIVSVARHAERALQELRGLDLAIVDPPRCGLDAAVIQALAANRVSTVFYVSCSPPSLARDLALFLARGYTVRRLEIYDFYPQTYHAECFAELSL